MGAVPNVRGNFAAAPAITARFPDLAGRTAIVTGTSHGIGCGIARVLGTQGMRLTLTARPDAEGQAFADSLTATGVDCQWVAADVATAEGARRQHHPYLVRWRGLRGHRGMAGYDASKGAIDALTRAMAVDLAPKGIRVNTVAPGAIRSRSEPAPATLPVSGAAAAAAASATASGNAPAPAPRRGRMVDGIPVPRLGEPDEVGAAVAFLASDAAAYVTGQILYVDGGLTAQLTPAGIFI
jgi:NAD(P)-dependent dehydrogenase (short-subunit alcohol dehydrogenase family)